MLSATPAMINLNSFADTSDYFSAPSSALEEVSKRLYTDEVPALAQAACVACSAPDSVPLCQLANTESWAL